ncbi:MAG: hypothetical protein AB7F35_26670 [Acetobacteraceae bacterium]
MKPRLALAFLLPIAALSLAACPNDSPIVPLPGPVAQLQRFQAAAEAGKTAEIADQAVNGDCLPGGSGSDACPALLAIHGRACLQQAQAEAGPDNACPGPTDTAKRYLECAERDLTRAVTIGGLKPDAVGGVQQNRALALYCRATFLPVAQGGPMVSAAEAALREAPDTAATNRLKAQAALYFAARDAVSKAERCAAVQRAKASAETGLTRNPNPRETEALQRLLADSARWGARVGCGSGA